MEAQIREFLNYLKVDKGLSKNTIESYRLGDDVLVSAYVKKKGRDHVGNGVSS